VTDYLFGSKQVDLIEKYKLLQKQGYSKSSKKPKKPTVIGGPSRHPVLTKVDMNLFIM